MTRRRPAGASALFAAALLLAGLVPSAAVAAPEDSDGVGVRVDITPLEEPTTEEPTTEEPTTEEPTTEKPTDGGEQPTDAEPTGTESPTSGTPSPTDTSTPGGDLPDTGVDLTTALWVTGPLLAAGAALALLAARRRGMTTGR